MTCVSDQSIVDILNMYSKYAVLDNKMWVGHVLNSIRTHVEETDEKKVGFMLDTFRSASMKSVRDIIKDISPDVFKVVAPLGTELQRNHYRYLVLTFLEFVNSRRY